MPASIELRFDPATESALRQVWTYASRHYGTDYVLRHGVIPHVALLVSEGDLTETFREAPLPDCTLRLEGVGYFAEGAVAYACVRSNSALRAYHEALFQSASASGLVIDPHYGPDRWVPHCTLAQECTQRRGIPVAMPGLDAQVRALIHVSYPPTRVVAERPCV